MTLVCDVCGRGTARPAINLALRVFCPRDAPTYGMDPGEHNADVRTYDEWKRLAAERQAA